MSAGSVAAPHPTKVRYPLPSSTRNTKNRCLKKKSFFELKNAQSIVAAFDGVSPLPPTYCYLKPDFLPVTMTLVRAGADRTSIRRGYARELRCHHSVSETHRASARSRDRLRDHGQSRFAPSGSKRTGRFNLLPGIRFEDGALLTGLEVIANRFGKKLDADSPIMNLRLPDGSRMAAHDSARRQSTSDDDHPQVHVARFHHG